MMFFITEINKGKRAFIYRKEWDYSYVWLRNYMNNISNGCFLLTKEMCDVRK